MSSSPYHIKSNQTNNFCPFLYMVDFFLQIKSKGTETISDQAFIRTYILNARPQTSNLKRNLNLHLVKVDQLSTKTKMTQECQCIASSRT